jgi:hypothetical protein
MLWLSFLSPPERHIDLKPSAVLKTVDFLLDRICWGEGQR